MILIKNTLVVIVVVTVILALTVVVIRILITVVKVILLTYSLARQALKEIMQFSYTYLMLEAEYGC